jgi:hypothetical protein
VSDKANRPTELAPTPEFLAEDNKELALAKLTPEEISQVRAFFELLDKWDKEMNHAD